MSKIEIPGIQYPTSTDPDIRTAFDNLFYLRRRVKELAAAADIATLSKSDVQNLINLALAQFKLGNPAFIVGTHAIRITTYGSASGPIGLAFVETDRNAIYVITNATGPKQWQFFAGSMVNSSANRPADLALPDAGFQFIQTDAFQETEYIWTGLKWATIGGYLQEIIDNATNTITTLSALRHKTSGAAANGFGLAGITELQDSAGTVRTASSDTVAWSNAGTNSTARQWWLRVAGTLTALMGLESSGNLSIIGAFLWKNATNFFGTLLHANTANRSYTFPDATGNITYETSALTNNNFLFGGGGALVKDAGFASPVPIANGGTGSTTAAGARTNLSAAQLQAPGAHTIALAKLTLAGTNGSISWSAEGVVTAFVDPT